MIFMCLGLFVVGADDRRAVGRAGVQAGDPRPFPSKSPSFDRVQDRVMRQRTPSASRILRTWDRLTLIPACRATAVGESSVHSGGPDSSAASGSPSACTVSRPGGGVLTRKIIRDRSVALTRGLRP